MSTQGYELSLALGDKPGRYAAQNPGLIPGDHVKVGFVCPPGSPARAEWMWLQVTAVEGDWPGALYRGRLCNRPLYLDPATIRPGQPVEFRAGHIYAVVRDSSDRPDGERETPPK
jgi:hypothetical protein